MRHEMGNSGILNQLSEGTGHIGLGNRPAALGTRKYPFGVDLEPLHVLDDGEHRGCQWNPVGALRLSQLAGNVPPPVAAVEIGPTHARDLVAALRRKQHEPEYAADG